VKTWILILTIGSSYGADGRQTAPTMTSVSGFTTAQACQAAGQQWKIDAGMFATWQCVPSG